MLVLIFFCCSRSEGCLKNSPCSEKFLGVAMHVRKVKITGAHILQRHDQEKLSVAARNSRSGCSTWLDLLWPYYHLYQLHFNERINFSSEEQGSVHIRINGNKDGHHIVTRRNHHQHKDFLFHLQT